MMAHGGGVDIFNLNEFATYAFAWQFFSDTCNVQCAMVLLLPLSSETHPVIQTPT